MPEGGPLRGHPWRIPQYHTHPWGMAAPEQWMGHPWGTAPWNISSPPQTTDFQEEMRRNVFDKDSSTWFRTIHRWHYYFPLLSDTPGPSYSNADAFHLVTLALLQQSTSTWRSADFKIPSHHKTGVFKTEDDLGHLQIRRLWAHSLPSLPCPEVFVQCNDVQHPQTQNPKSRWLH